MIEKLIGRKFDVCIREGKVVSMSEQEGSARVNAAKEGLAGVEAWEKLGNGGYGKGICCCMPGYPESKNPLIDEAFMAWPEFSGNTEFPIPGKFAGKEDPRWGWFKARDNPKKHPSYIQARGRLARHCREYFEQIIREGGE